MDTQRLPHIPKQALQTTSQSLLPASEVYQQECNQDILRAPDAHDVKVMHMGYVCEEHRQEPPVQHAKKVLRQEIKRGQLEGARQEGPTCQETYMLWPKQAVSCSRADCRTVPWSAWLRR